MGLRTAGALAAAAAFAGSSTAASSTLVDGNLLLAGVIALAAGVVSFASPCVLPLVPGFLGYVTGLSGQTGRPGQARQAGPGGPPREGSRGGAGVAGSPYAVPRRSRVLAGAALFVAGFSVVFLAGIVLATAAGMALLAQQRAVSIIGGILVIVLALAFLGVGSQASWAPRWRPVAGLAGAPLLGMVFAVSWSPCIGPTLGVIMTLATTTGGGSVGRGAALGAAYCLGLGVPFLLVAAGFSWATSASAWLRRHHRALQVVGGGMLLVVGILLLTGAWGAVVAWLQVHLIGSFVPAL